MNNSVQDRIDRLRLLSEERPPEQLQRLKEIQDQTRLIGKIFGVYGVIDSKMKKNEKELLKKEMTFEEKRTLFQAEFPNKISPEKRAKAREKLAFIAKNPHLFPIKNTSSPSSPLSFNGNNFTFQSSTATDDIESKNDLTAPRVGKRSWTDCSISSTSLPQKKSSNESSNWDSLSQMTYDAAYSASTQSLATPINQMSTNMKVHEKSEISLSSSMCSQ